MAEAAVEAIVAKAAVEAEAETGGKDGGGVP